MRWVWVGRAKTRPGRVKIVGLQAACRHSGALHSGRARRFESLCVLLAVKRRDSLAFDFLLALVDQVEDVLL